MPATIDHVCLSRIAFEQATAKGFDAVSILSAGEARGHGILVDETTIAQFIGATLGKTVPSYLTHEDAGTDRLGDEIGMFSGFYREGLRVRANFRFLQSFIDNEPEEYGTLTELATEYPDQLGISPVIRLALTWPMPDGTEQADTGMRPDGSVTDMPCVRVLGVDSCDFVKTPAANTALFSAKVDDTPTTKPITMPENTILLTAHNEVLAAKDGELVALATSHKDAIAALEAKHTEAVTALSAKLAEVESTLTAANAEKAALTATLAAKTLEADEAAKYDMRKAGAPALETALSSFAEQQLPAPAKTDRQRWEQYAELAAKDLTAAQLFEAKYLSRK